MYFCGSIGVLAGFMYAYQNSFGGDRCSLYLFELPYLGRLMGLLPNDVELEAAGMKKREHYLDS